MHDMTDFDPDSPYIWAVVAVLFVLWVWAEIDSHRKG